MTATSGQGLAAPAGLGENWLDDAFVRVGELLDRPLAYVAERLEPRSRPPQLPFEPVATIVVGDPAGRRFGTICCGPGADGRGLSERDAALLGLLAHLVADRLECEEILHERELLSRRAAAVEALVAAVQTRDHYTAAHSASVVDLAARVARRLELPPDVQMQVEQVALLHDLGKVAIPDDILLKPGPLDDDEWAWMQRHPVEGERIVAAIPDLAHLAPAIRAEHERWDGGGYPDGLRGEQIPVASRIVLVCDAYDAMTSDRPYRQALSPAHARGELRSCAGVQFCPAAVDALIAVLDDRPLIGHRFTRVAA
jgi:HD-GYP domain-containing protein (c-di-GMP phosphodiesterase class II)